jgi:hypothetical protein
LKKKNAKAQKQKKSELLELLVPDPLRAAELYNCAAIRARGLGPLLMRGVGLGWLNRVGSGFYYFEFEYLLLFREKSEQIILCSKPRQ